MFVEVRFGDAGAKVPWNQLFNSQCTGASLLAFIRQACVRAAEQLARDTDAQLRREIGEATDKHMILQHKEAARDAEEDAPEGAAEELQAAEDAKSKLEAKLEKFTEAWRALRARLGDPELVMDLQAPDGSVVGLRNIGAKYSSEVLGDRNVYTLCSVDGEGEASPLTFTLNSEA